MQALEFGAHVDPSRFVDRCNGVFRQYLRRTKHTVKVGGACARTSQSITTEGLAVRLARDYAVERRTPFNKDHWGHAQVKIFVDLSAALADLC